MANILQTRQPLVMGIINLSPDSFYEGSRSLTQEDFEKRYGIMLEQGADIVDIGACSTRPGSTPVEEEVEWELLKPALKIILKVFPHSTFSLDTFRSSIVERAYDFVGDFIINDISSGEDDSEMIPMAARLELPYIAMHKKGTQQTMQSLCQYEDVVKEVAEYFRLFVQKATQAGIKEIIVDPGFGFAKNLDQNYQLLNNLNGLKPVKEDGTSYPLLAGISRKSMIYRLLESTPDEVLSATSALNLLALVNGADILRVHDVKEAKEIITLFRTITKNR
ncbi:MAG: dihydropteroate synthase [Bacteroidales bacterium]|nr:dihydropteroate synthase [Bacteroidales bacterium]